MQSAVLVLQNALENLLDPDNEEFRKIGVTIEQFRLLLHEKQATLFSTADDTGSHADCVQHLGLQCSLAGKYLKSSLCRYTEETNTKHRCCKRGEPGLLTATCLEVK